MKFHNLLFVVALLCGAVSLGAQVPDARLLDQRTFTETWERSQATGMGAADQFADKVNLYRGFRPSADGLRLVYIASFKSIKDKMYYVETMALRSEPDPAGKKADEQMPGTPVQYSSVQRASLDEALGNLLHKGVTIPEDSTQKQLLLEKEAEQLEWGINYTQEELGSVTKSPMLRIRILMETAGKTGKKYVSAQFYIKFANAQTRPKLG